MSESLVHMVADMLKSETRGTGASQTEELARLLVERRFPRALQTAAAVVVPALAAAAATAAAAAA